MPSDLLRALALAPLLALALHAHGTEEQKLTASDAAPGDFLGRSLDVDGETLIAGATGVDALGANAGAAYVWAHAGAVWVEQAKLLAADGAAGDLFGRAVAVRGDVAVVGASGCDDVGADGGAAYVFTRSGTAWTQEAKLLASDGAAGHAFGTSVALADGVALVGAPGGQAAYVFRRSGTTWVEEARLAASDATAQNAFGTSVALVPGLALVGASRQDGIGAAYLFEEAAGAWSEAAKLTALDADAGDAFGASVALDDEPVAVVGAPLDDERGFDAGASYRFRQASGGWAQEAKRLALAAGDGMGFSVDVSYFFTIAGARFHDLSGRSSAGAGILWWHAQSNLAQIYVASDQASGALVGNAVAIDGCTTALASVGNDAAGNDAGAVYVYHTLESYNQVVNGSGLNPVVLSSVSGPAVGRDWVLAVDTSAFPTVDLTQLVIFRWFRAAPLATPWGELLVDTRGSRLRHSLAFGSGVVTHRVPVPPDLYLVGVRVAVQAALRDTAAGRLVTFTNGELGMLGCADPGN